ncbi:MAG: response regulator [Pseudanabaenaceae cyanobacterium bins.39]|nr:response regulator [Pseudanabaenaceae cyanobacterium bins.39]
MPSGNILEDVESLHPKSLLFVDDSDEDYEMFLRAVKKAGFKFPMMRCESGEKALAVLGDRQANVEPPNFAKPALILLDLNLPGLDGLHILNTIKSHPQLKLIPVVIFSTSSNPKDVRNCYQSGANAYVIKPMDVSLLQKCVQAILTHWLDVNITCI